MLRNAIATSLLAIFACAPAQAQMGNGPDIWPDLVRDVFDGRPMQDGAGVISLEAPYRAEDAAIVPMTIRSELPAGAKLRIKKITFVIDNNPAPVAAEFTFGDEGAIHAIETRVRVDSYTNVHVVAEASDGNLYMAEKFVKASGGCSAPSLKVAGNASEIGDMQFRRFDPPAEGLSEAQLMIRHPNNSGLQRDPITNYYIPAYFVQDLTVKVDDRPLFAMAGGISISENPTFRVTYSGLADGAVTVEAKDTKGAVFTGEWPAGGGAS
jgi:sulfur-oxidizing protein SoxY